MTEEISILKALVERLRVEGLALIEENQKLKAEIEEYQKSGLACIRGAKTLPAERYLQFEDIESKYHTLQQESTQAIEKLNEITDLLRNESVTDGNYELMDKLQSILKRDPK